MFFVPRSHGRAVAALALALLVSGCARFLEIENAELEIPPQPEVELGTPGARGLSGRATSGVLADGRRPRADRVSDIRRPEIFSPRPFDEGRNEAPPGASQTLDGDINLNFAEAEVADAAKLILATTLERNYIVDPRVKGKLTFRTSRPLSRPAVLTVFDAVLNTVGATLIDDGDLVRILPISDSKEAGIPVRANGANAPGHSIRIVPLKYVKAADMREIVTGMVGENRVLAVNEGLNVIILAGAERALKPVLTSLQAFDDDRFAGMAFGIYPLKNVEATTAVADMDAIFLTKDAGPRLAVRFLPIKRINSVIVISRTEETIRDMMDWLERLDQQSVSEDQRIFIYFAQNTKAKDLADSLSELLEDNAATPGGERDPLGPPSLLTAQPVNAAGDGGAPPPPPPSRGDSGGPAGSVGTLSATNVKLVAEEQRNAILVTTTTREWRKIEAILTQLDVPPLQVLLEVKIIEVQLNDNLQYGLQWFFESGNNTVAFSQVASGAVAATFPGFSYVFSSTDIRVALDALSDLTNVKVISSPSMTVINNRTASLQVGDQVPIAVQSAVGVADPDAPIVNTIQFRDTGVILNVTPRVNNSGLVVAEIEQEVSGVAETVTSGIDSPTIQQRRLKSTIAVADGETIALGGVIQDRRTQTKSGVPGLSDIPLLGAAFRSTGDRVLRTELLVIVTPRIVRNGADAQELTSELLSRMERMRPFDE